MEEMEEMHFSFPATSPNCLATSTAYTDASIAIASQRFDTPSRIADEPGQK